MDVEAIQKELNVFSKDRDWEQFHTPKNLVMALSGEVGEISDIFQWLTEDQSKNLDAATINHASEELADIFIYLLRLYDVLGIDPSESIENKMKVNADKYPVILSKGNATKYNKRDV